MLSDTFDLNLSRVIASIESSFDAHAMRFESELYSNPKCNPSDSLLHAIQANNACDSATARMICYTSWGQYQLMGFNIYDLGYAHDVISFANDATAQAILYQEFLEKKNINETLADLLSDSVKMMQFAVTYNGSAKYADSIRSTAVRLKLAST